MLKYFSFLTYIDGYTWQTYKQIIQFTLGAIILMILATLYTAFAAKKKSFGFAFCIKLLRFLIWMMTQFLYFPIF
jgi:hypothetical protein